MRAEIDGSLSVRQPTLLLDVIPAPKGTKTPASQALPDRQSTERELVEQTLTPFLNEVNTQRTSENQVISKHMEISLRELIHRQNLQLADLVSKQQSGDTSPGLAGNIAQAEQHLDDLNLRLTQRRDELEMERQCTIGDINHFGRAWILPHPERTSPGIAPMVRDDEIEQIAVQEATRYEEARGWVVESVESDNRGFDLISRKLSLGDANNFADVRFIEVKGRAQVGEVALSDNEYKTAQRLGEDYWLYVVYNCATKPELLVVRNPARLCWKPVMRVEHYHLGEKDLLRGSNGEP